MDTLHTHIRVYLFISCQYFFIYLQFYVCGCFGYMYVCESCACLLPRRLEETVRSPGTEVTVISYHMGARNRDPLEKQSV